METANIGGFMLICSVVVHEAWFLTMEIAKKIYPNLPKLILLFCVLNTIHMLENVNVGALGSL